MSILDISHLRKYYRGPDGSSTPVLEVPVFQMTPSEQVALFGGSGSGKTTLLHLIAGLLRPDEGSITVDGTVVNTLGEAARDRFRARRLGYIFQTFNLLQGFTALENVCLGMFFGGEVDEAEARTLLTRVGLKDRLHYRPSQLSVGQQQRVAVARAMVGRPALVLADEPTGSLDVTQTTAALELIRAVCRETGAALLLVSHDRRILGQFDRVEDLAQLNRVAQPQDQTVGGSR